MNKNTFSYDKAIKWMAIGATICALYVVLGAFGSHGLEGKLSDKQLGTFGTALRYMVIHGLALILTNLSYIVLKKYNAWANWFAVAGLVFFSLSLLIHATKDLVGIDINVFAILAPVGGLAYIIFWILFTVTISKK